MSDAEKKAQELMAEAEKKLTGGKSFMSSIFGGSSNKTEDAIECYQRAANMFKMGKNWAAAGEAFCKAGDLHFKNGSKHDAATNFCDAATCFKKVDVKEASANLQRAIELYLEMGRFQIAAKHHQTIGEMLESDGDLNAAIQHYEQAAEYFKGEESNAAASACMKKVAAHAATAEDYVKAIKVYEEIASTSLESSLLKYTAKEFFFRAALCHLCVDMLNARQALDRYADMCPSFADTREFKLVKTLTTYVEEEDADGFTEAVAEYDSISRLEQWYTTLLLRVKKGLNQEGELC